MANNEHISKVQKFKSKKHDKHLSNNMLIADNLKASDEDMNKNMKYVGIMQVAKNKFKSKSQVPADHMLIQTGQNSFDMDQSNSPMLTGHAVSMNDLSQPVSAINKTPNPVTLNYEGIPADSEDKQRVNINMFIPSQISGEVNDQPIKGVSNLQRILQGKN